MVPTPMAERRERRRFAPPEGVRSGPAGRSGRPGPDANGSSPALAGRGETQAGHRPDGSPAKASESPAPVQSPCCNSPESCKSQVDRMDGIR